MDLTTSGAPWGETSGRTLPQGSAPSDPIILAPLQIQPRLDLRKEDPPRGTGARRTMAGDGGGGGRTYGSSTMGDTTRRNLGALIASVHAGRAGSDPAGAAPTIDAMLTPRTT